MKKEEYFMVFCLWFSISLLLYIYTIFFSVFFPSCTSTIYVVYTCAVVVYTKKNENFPKKKIIYESLSIMGVLSNVVVM